MKIITLFDSIHGKSKKIASLLPNSHYVCNLPNLLKYEYFIFVCPTYGDEEITYNMETFLLNLKIKKRKYTICELGNYFGDTYEFGAKKIIVQFLKKLKWEEFYPCLSLDSMPAIDLDTFKIWERKLNAILRKHNCK